MKRDPYKHKEKYLKWKDDIKKKKKIEGISKINSDLIIKYVFDMEIGINISSASSKGPRGYARLNNLRHRMRNLCKKLEDIYALRNIGELNEEQIMTFFAKMRSGEIKREDGKAYRSTGDAVKEFKAFWHWYIKIKKKEGKEIQDIAIDLDTSKDKPKWVYLDEPQMKLLADTAKYKYKVLVWFLLDTGIRSPTELLNVKVGDFYDDFKELNIREEASKTFGRRIKLMICSKFIEEYVKREKLSKEDYLFSFNPQKVNEYFRRLAKRIFGENISPAGEKYSNLTLYDFRHISCCYWLPRYKSESALKFRFGWKKSDKIHYYSELLGMRDTINDEDMLIDVTKVELERKLDATEKKNSILQERVDKMEKQMKMIFKLMRKEVIEIEN